MKGAEKEEAARTEWHPLDQHARRARPGFRPVIEFIAENQSNREPMKFGKICVLWQLRLQFYKCTIWIFQGSEPTVGCGS